MLNFQKVPMKIPINKYPFGFHSNPIDENWYSGISFEEEDYPPVTAYPSRRLAWALWFHPKKFRPHVGGPRLR